MPSFEFQEVKETERFTLEKTLWNVDYRRFNELQNPSKNICHTHEEKALSPLLSRPPHPVYLANLKTSIILKISFLVMNDCDKIFYFILKGRLYDSVEKKKKNTKT